MIKNLNKHVDLVQVDHAWLFDIDGVITNPNEKKANLQIIRMIVSFMEEGEIIGLNTGRSLNFIIEELMNNIENKIKDKKFLKKIYIVGERGGVWAHYKNDQLKTNVDKTLTPPETLVKKINEIIKSEFSDTTFFDESKQTMISAEAKKNIDLNKYSDSQKKFIKKARLILDQMNLNDYTIEPTVIAVDIQHEKSGKDLGVKKFLEMIKDLHEPNEFITFGDSPGDLAMHKFLIKNNHKSKFIYVGKAEIENNKNIIKTKEKYDKGTLEFLKSNLYK